MIRRGLTVLLPYLGAYVGACVPALGIYLALGRSPLWALALGSVVVLGLAGYHLVHLALGRAIRRRRVAELARTAQEIPRTDVTEDTPVRSRPRLRPGDRVGEPVETAEDAEPQRRVRRPRRPSQAPPPGAGLHRPPADPRRRNQ